MEGRKVEAHINVKIGLLGTSAYNEAEAVCDGS